MDQAGSVSAIPGLARKSSESRLSSCGAHVDTVSIMTGARALPMVGGYIRNPTRLIARAISTVVVHIYFLHRARWPTTSSSWAPGRRRYYCLPGSRVDHVRGIVIREHPSARRFASKFNQFDYSCEIVAKISLKYRLMVSDSVSQVTKLIQIVVDPLAYSSHWPCSRIGQHNCQMGFPDTVVVATGKHPLPEGELQFWYHLTSGGDVTTGRGQILFLVVTTRRIREASLETC